MSRTMDGWIDGRGQPVMSVRLAGLEDPYVALIDTGFNRELIIFEEHAVQACLSIRHSRVPILLADGFRSEFLVSKGVVEWFGVEKIVELFIIPGPAPRVGRWQIGTQLLQDCRLEIDFLTRSVRLFRDG